jgi:hypothetical protein
VCVCGATAGRVRAGTRRRRWICKRENHLNRGRTQDTRRDTSSRHPARRSAAPHRRSAHVSALTPAPGSSPAVGQGRRATQEHVVARSAHEDPHPDLPVPDGRRGAGRRWSCSITLSCFRSRCFERRREMRTGMRTHTVHVHRYGDRMPSPGVEHTGDATTRGRRARIGRSSLPVTMRAGRG